jgi:hypothetical protein
VTTTETRICHADGCLNALVGRQRKYCSHTCSARQSYRRRNGLEGTFAGKYDELAADDDFLRRGDLYQVLGDHPVATQVLEGDIGIGEAADILGVDRTAMTRALAAVVVDRREAAGLVPALEEGVARGLLGPSDTEIPDPDTAAFDEFLDALVAAFVRFRDRYFEQARRGEEIVRFVNKEYHRKWIRAILRAILLGEQQMVLSPPRHGKTELLIHFCVWLIVRNPDIRIMWVAKNEEMAEDMVGAVKDHLANNTQLIEDFLGSEGRYKPKRGGWGRLKFRVAARTITGQKASTMVGVGWTGTILSRDVDVIILDDVIDDRNTAQPGQREANRHKLVTAIDSRNETHTAFFIIGSRQHWDDFYGYLIEDANWGTIVEQAHDDNCPQDPHDLEAHYECMLWPEKHPYSWWYQKWQSQTAMGLEHLFEMVWQNRPRPSSRISFPKEALLAARNRDRRIGDFGWFHTEDEHGDLVPRFPFQLVAGLDPAAVGHQAAWLWLYRHSNSRRYMLDADNPLGGGIDQFLDLLVAWHEKYGLRHWVVETANIQRLYLDDSRIRKEASQRGIALDRHQTGENKVDKEYGIPAMGHWYIEEMVDLPYGDDRSRELVDAFTRQALNFDPDDVRKRKRTADLLDASWFPLKVLRALMTERVGRAEVTYEPMFAEYETTSYEGVPW